MNPSPSQLQRLLLPQPKQCEWSDSWVTLTQSHHQWLKEYQATGNASTRPKAPSLVAQINPSTTSRPQGYSIHISTSEITLQGTDEAGLNYALCTLKQLISLANNRIPCGVITDWPDFLHRGVMLDISRDKVPTMETLFSIIDTLSSWKINQFQLYTEHTFAYAGHETVWQNASPLTSEQIHKLDAHCLKHGIELVANQNSFGHMHRWLIHEPYRQLAECPEGIEHAFSPKPEPFGLCPTNPQSLTFLDDLYTQLLPCFQSNWVNVGLDETIDLGIGKSKQACNELGKGRVYLNFVKHIHKLLAKHGKQMQFWGDIILQYPELIRELPKDAVVLEWGYEADHPFDKHGSQFAKAGLDYYVCPGTSAWNSIAGRTDNAIANLANAAQNGLKHGAAGYLITDWGDNGHLQPLTTSYPGWLTGAAFAWSVPSSAQLESFPLPQLLDHHLFQDSAQIMGQLVCDLGNAYQQTGVILANRSLLFQLLIFPEKNLPRLSEWGVNTQALMSTQTFIAQTLARLGQANMQQMDEDIIVTEITWAAQALTLGAQIGISGLKQSLKAPLEDLAQKHRAQWLLRNRPGGLNESHARLQRVIKLLAD
ncbi:MAG TPA: glycoside hydrolase [Myxococcales bacterium]|nr:glycoside hydrolase [Myxococcales bacterium]